MAVILVGKWWNFGMDSWIELRSMMTVMITRKMMLLINERDPRNAEKQMVMKSFHNWAEEAKAHDWPTRGRRISQASIPPTVNNPHHHDHAFSLFSQHYHVTMTHLCPHHFCQFLLHYCVRFQPNIFELAWWLGWSIIIKGQRWVKFMTKGVSLVH